MILNFPTKPQPTTTATTNKIVMTIHHIIGLVGTALFFYALWMCLLGATYVCIDLFSDWYHQFKQARKDKAAQKSVTDKQSGGIAK